MDALPTISVPLSEILADPNFNCRGAINPSSAIELSRNIEKHGLLQPITIQPYDKIPPYKYRIVIGHRRYEAFRILSSKRNPNHEKYLEIPCTIKDGLNEIDAHALNLVENIERQDLNIKQEADAIKIFLDAGLNDSDIIQQLGGKVSKGWLQIRKTLLKLDPLIQLEAAAGYLTQEQIKDLYGLSKEDQFQAVKNIKESRFRGEKRSLKIKKTKKRFNPLRCKPRTKTEIDELKEMLVDQIGSFIGTRILAWAGGEISDLELAGSLKEYAEENGKKYSIPRELLGLMAAVN